MQMRRGMRNSLLVAGVLAMAGSAYAVVDLEVISPKPGGAWTFLAPVVVGANVAADSPFTLDARSNVGIALFASGSGSRNTSLHGGSSSAWPVPVLDIQANNQNASTAGVGDIGNGFGTEVAISGNFHEIVESGASSQVQAPSSDGGILLDISGGLSWANITANYATGQSVAAQTIRPQFIRNAFRGPKAIALSLDPSLENDGAGSGDTMEGLEIVPSLITGTLSNWNGIHIYGPPTTTTTNTSIVVDPGTQATTNTGFKQIGATVDNRLAGLTVVGSSSTAPHARLHALDPTLGQEVFRVETTATNDDPNYKMFQSRGAGTASSTLNLDLLLTSAAPTDAPCPSGATCFVESRTVCHCTSGSVCSGSNLGGSDVGKMTVANVAGSISLLTGSSATDTTQKDTAPSITSITLSMSGTTTARVAVVIPANANHTCHVTWIIQSVGT